MRAALTSLLFLTPLLVPMAFADHADDVFVASGHILVGNPSSQFVGSTAELGLADGVDSAVVEVPAWAPGHPAWLNGTSDAPYDLDLHFYDADGNWLGDACATGAPDEACLVPEDATVGYVDLWSGADVAFTFVLRSTAVGPPPPPPPVGYEIPMFGPFTWPKTDLSVVVVPSTAGPLYDDAPTARPEGLGVGPDAAYVDAVLDAMTAWDAAMDAYALDHPDAAWLAAFDFDVKVVGRDATPADADSADIRILFSPAVPLGVGVLGVAIATETDDDGRFIHCDVINADWLVFSYTAADMYNIHAQEFGHCLGLGHPEEPADDVMNGAYDYFPGDAATPRMCVSSLDVRGLEAAYAWVGEGAPWRAAPLVVTQAPGEYVRYPAVGASGPCP